MSSHHPSVVRRAVVVSPRDRLPEQTTIAQASRLARLMDSQFEIPGLRVRFGFDALLGLLPGIGDTVSAFASLYILQAAWEARVPRVTLIRMVLNVLLDVIFGAVPVLGDLFDLAWKANIKNVELLEKHLAASPHEARRARRSDTIFVVGGFVAVVAAASFAATVSVLIARTVFQAIF